MIPTIVVDEVSVVGLQPSNLKVEIPAIGIHRDGKDGEVFTNLAGVFTGRLFLFDEISKVRLRTLGDGIASYAESVVEEKIRNEVIKK